MRASFGFVGVVLCLLSSMAGCGSEHGDLVHVIGTVTFQGQPVARGKVCFCPADPQIGSKQRPSTSFTDTNGQYRLQAYRGTAGLPPGDYLVTVTASEAAFDEAPGASKALPLKYADVRTSGLKANVPADAAGEVNMDFTLQ